MAPDKIGYKEVMHACVFFLGSQVSMRPKCVKFRTLSRILL